MLGTISNSTERRGRCGGVRDNLRAWRHLGLGAGDLSLLWIHSEANRVVLGESGSIDKFLKATVPKLNHRRR
jgi:hypothetical protein